MRNLRGTEPTVSCDLIEAGIFEIGVTVKLEEISRINCGAQNRDVPYHLNSIGTPVFKILDNNKF